MTASLRKCALDFNSIIARDEQKRDECGKFASGGGSSAAAGKGNAAGRPDLARKRFPKPKANAQKRSMNLKNWLTNFDKAFRVRSAKRA